MTMPHGRTMSCSLCVHFRVNEPSMLLAFPEPPDLPVFFTLPVFLPLMFRLDSSSLCSRIVHVLKPGSLGITHPLTQRLLPSSVCLWQNSSVTLDSGSLQSKTLQQGCPTVTPSVTAADILSFLDSAMYGVRSRRTSAHISSHFQPLLRFYSNPCMCGANVLGRSQLLLSSFRS